MRLPYGLGKPLGRLGQSLQIPQDRILGLHVVAEDVLALPGVPLDAGDALLDMQQIEERDSKGLRLAEHLGTNVLVQGGFSHYVDFAARQILQVDDQTGREPRGIHPTAAPRRTASRPYFSRMASILRSRSRSSGSS